MDERPNDFLALLRQEPERTGSMLKFAVVAPLVIVVCSVGGAMLLPVLVVAPLTTVLIFVYGVVLAYMSGKMVKTADQWQIESAMQARRIMPAAKPLEPEALVFNEPIPL